MSYEFRLPSPIDTTSLRQDALRQQLALLQQPTQTQTLAPIIGKAFGDITGGITEGLKKRKVLEAQQVAADYTAKLNSGAPLSPQDHAAGGSAYMSLGLPVPSGYVSPSLISKMSKDAGIEGPISPTKENASVLQGLEKLKKRIQIPQDQADALRGKFNIPASADPMYTDEIPGLKLLAPARPAGVSSDFDSLSPARQKALLSGLDSGQITIQDINTRGAKVQLLADALIRNPKFTATTGLAQRTFDKGQASFASSGQIEGPLTYMKSVIPNMDHLQELSDRLPKGQYPILNRAKLALMMQSGDPNAVAYATATTEVADQIAKILQGGGSGGSTSDAKLRQAGELFDKGFSPAQMNAVVREIKALLANRVAALESVQAKYKPASSTAVPVHAEAPAAGNKLKDAIDAF